MVVDKNAKSDSHFLQQKQRLAIQRLQNENNKLKDEILLDNKCNPSGHGYATSVQIAKLQDQADLYTRKIETEKRRVSELDKQIAEMNQRIMEQRRQMGGVNAARENNQQTQRQIKILENRLEKALVKYNEALGKNKKLKEQIDSLRRERLVFDQIYKKLEKELEEKKREMANIIEVSNSAYEARDAALQELTILQNQADKEQAAFESEWRELGKMIDEDKKMKDIMKVKESKRSSDAAGDDGSAGDGEKKGKKKLMSKDWVSMKEKALHRNQVDRIKSYSEAFQKIQEATGITDIDELVTKFLDAEDQNFTLFTYVNDLNLEIEKVESQINDIKSDIEKYKGQGNDSESQRKKILDQLEDKLRQTEEKTEQTERQYEQSTKTISGLKSGIFNIFNRIGCASLTNKELLDSGIKQANMMQYLGIIEQRTNELLQIYATSQTNQPQDGASSMVLGTGPSVPSGHTAISIEPPSVLAEQSDESDADDNAEEERPLNREEISQRVNKRMQKRLNSKSKSLPGKALPGSRSRFKE
ncbi:outer dynein arm protein 1 [Chloropicon primus]|uniref:Outer dynein arm protein 1 n=1 Tax=Chloropicon primus TaxID=1764295 RepID=A0A5B8N080_9CHLO|nr:outer dynein arm protein 1 [Chloropicon primus]UPR04590.1 outer dynein arm protein 1 [Chloropicon primus]|eukprot:QDZ25392.1 outer dynein arm protein 1 [Chloropicon primus]